MNFKPIEFIDRRTGERKIEKVPGENFLKFLYYNPLGELSLESVIKRKFLTAFYGKQMDKESSVNKIQGLIESAGINMEESKKQKSEFKTFNEFFIRELKEGARPIDVNENHLVSPADGKIFAYQNIAEVSNFFIKGEEFTLEEFFKDKILAEKYKNGALVIVRLAPIDYHRFHFPADGTISEGKKIHGYYYSVSTYAIRKNFRIYCENKREYSILKTKKFGDIVIAEIAATMVGGIKQSYKENTEIKKGEEKGCFFFGGSTTILLFEKNKIVIDEDILKNSQNSIETKVFMGEKIGVSV
ncbi:MAG: phosphatidylserine decarboxylase [Fusobacteriaceae bacterium]